jgi:RNA-binding protein YlmH
MTTVGYGDVVVNTPVGRFIAITMIFTGAYLTALLIAVQSNLLSLTDTGKFAIVQSTEQKTALDVIVAALRFQVARSKRYRMSGDANQTDHIPTKEELE